jgi:hypothetical protein
MRLTITQQNGVKYTIDNVKSIAYEYDHRDKAQIIRVRNERYECDNPNDPNSDIHLFFDDTFLYNSEIKTILIGSL